MIMLKFVLGARTIAVVIGSSYCINNKSNKNVWIYVFFKR